VVGGEVETRVRVRYAEVDRMGYAWHGHYLAYFEQARTDWLRVRGASYRALEDDGTLLVVAETGVKFLRPAGYDDELVITARLAEMRGPRIRFEYDVRRDARLLATGFTVLASADKTGRPCRPPELLRRLAKDAGLRDVDAHGTPPGAGAVQGRRP
jgi:acyl-CoA thioester hydrolase